MHASRIVARVLEGVQDLMHAARCRALHDVVGAAVGGAALSLTGLALRTSRPTALRHRVKCVDRLLSNTYLDIERQAVYAALARQWLSGLPQLLIVVDWSSLTADLRWHWLRASVVIEGRSLTLYEEVHPRCRLANLAVHRRFIERLARILPPSPLPPIILTDAGFRNPWFKLVAQRGWHWVGRIRNRDFVRQARPHALEEYAQLQEFAAADLDLRERREARELHAAGGRVHHAAIAHRGPHLDPFPGLEGAVAVADLHHGERLGDEVRARVLHRGEQHVQVLLGQRQDALALHAERA